MYLEFIYSASFSGIIFNKSNSKDLSQLQLNWLQILIWKWNINKKCITI